jgi:hypothetical protein
MGYCKLQEDRKYELFSKEPSILSTDPGSQKNAKKQNKINKQKLVK